MFRTLRPSGSRISTSRSSNIAELFSPYHQLYTQSGTAALAAALSSVKKLRSDISSPEVLLPAYCCPDLISALIFTGIKPVLIDFEKNTPWLDLVKLDQTISSSTIAILAVNFLGIQERIGKIREILPQQGYDTNAVNQAIATVSVIKNKEGAKWLIWQNPLMEVFG